MTILDPRHREPPRVPTPWRAPDESAFVDPHADRVLSTYLRSVLQWHGYIRFLGLPHLHDNPDVPIDLLFVEPSVSRGWLRPEAYPREPRVEPFQNAVKEFSRLVLLGDPGSGKSTVVNYLAWYLAIRVGRSHVDWLTGRATTRRLLPLPMILRELAIRRGVTWDGLLKAFCEHPMNRETDDLRPALDAALERGQALVMLDGLDEIGNIEGRRDLRDAVLDCMDRYPACRWLLTSRIVGYEDVPFHRLPATDGVGVGDRDRATTTKARRLEEEVLDKGLPPGLGLRESAFTDVAELRHVAPFSDGQIERFVNNWFSQRDAIRTRAEVTGSELIRAIRGDRGVRDLARIPNLLTLIALIYRVEAWLPNGRARLYDKIAQAYLESIDRVRHLRTLEYDWQDIKSWLARVGFEVQLRRGDGGSRTRRGGEDGERQLLVTETDVREWFTAAMQESGRPASQEQVRELIDYLGRRSGLLLPRGVAPDGQNLFAFMHLSFQEYFAAWFLREQILSAGWTEGRTDPPEAQPEALKTRTRDPQWREPLILVFELLERERRWPQTLLEQLFGLDFEHLQPVAVETAAAVRLLAQLAVDRQSGLPSATRDAAVKHAVAWEAELQDGDSNPVWYGRVSSVLGDALAFAEEDRVHQIIAFLQEEIASRRLTGWSFFDSAVSDLSPLSGLTGLQWLSLTQTAVSDLSPLGGLTGLQLLYLFQTAVSDLRPLSGLTGLQWLSLTQTAVSDLSPLGGLTGLRGLYLIQTAVSDLRPLSGLTGLKELVLNQTAVSDLSPLSGLTGLQLLYLFQTAVSDLRPLSGLTGLQWLGLNQTAVSDEERQRFQAERCRRGLREVEFL